MMLEGRIVAICRFGGEFVTKDNGTMSYKGGEAHAMGISRDMNFSDLKSEIANMFDVDSRTMSIKYFLPNNRETLITVSSDKDVERMVDFSISSKPTDIYVLKVDNRATGTSFLDNSMVTTAAADHNLRPRKVTASKRSSNRATRGRTLMADLNTPEVGIGSAADNIRQEESNTAERVENRTTVASDSVACAVDPAFNSVAWQQSVTPERVDNRVTRRTVAESNIPGMVSPNTTDHVGPHCSDTVMDDLHVGQEFDNAKAFRDELIKYAFVKGFTYRFIKNDHVRCIVKCTSENCQWRIHASASTRKQVFTIKKINNIHTCNAGNHRDGNGRAVKQWLVSIVKEKLLENSQSKPKDIVKDLCRDYGISVKYAQVWQAKEVAQKELHMLREVLCNQLPYLCTRIMETNPGSVAITAASSNLNIYRFLVSFHASLCGFEDGCRPLLFLDRIPLKVNNQWKLLAAVAVDGDDEIFPVAFAAVESETHDSWHWFLVQLEAAVRSSQNLTIVSSRHKGLDESVPQVFEGCCHRYSLLHLIDDFKAELKKGSWSDKVKDEMVQDFKGAAHAYKVDEFNSCIERIHNVSKDVAEWVKSINPENWSNALGRGSCYDHVSSNIVESVSKWIEVKHESSVVQIIAAICSKMIEVMGLRQQACSTWVGILTPHMEKKLQEEISKTQVLSVICSSDTLFEVRGNTINVVNIGSWECTCRRWQITGLPCMHAIAVFNRIGRSVYDYCARYFRSDYYVLTYSAPIHPIPDIERISSIPELISYPPPTSRSPTQPKRKRINPYKTSIRPLHCSRCKVAGHNKATCEAQL